MPRPCSFVAVISCTCVNDCNKINAANKTIILFYCTWNHIFTAVWWLPVCVAHNQRGMARLNWLGLPEISHSSEYSPTFLSDALLTYIRRSISDVAVRKKTTTPLWEITCHNRSHSVTCHPAFTPAEAGTRFCRPRKHARLSLPRWWLYPEIVYPPNTVTYLRNNQSMSGQGVRPTIHESDSVTVNSNLCVCRRDLPFSECAHLKNPWNDDKPVKVGRDGQVLHDTTWWHTQSHVCCCIDMYDCLAPKDVAAKISCFVLQMIQILSKMRQ